MKNKGLIIFLITTLSVISILLIMFMIGLLNNHSWFNSFLFNYTVSNELVIDETYDDNFNKINIEASAADIYIKESNDEFVKAIIYGDKDKTIVDTKNSELKIELKEKRCIGFCFNYKISKIEIYLPKDYNDEINITNKLGDIKIDEFLNANINVSEDCGDVTIKSGNIVNVNNKYGDITLNNAQTANIDAKAGDVKIGIVNDVTVNNDFGDIKIDKVNNYLNLKNNCGDIKIDNIDLHKNSYIIDDLGDIEIGNTNEIYIDAKVSLGDVKVNNNYNKSDITLKIDNSCGDIKVNN